MNRARTIGTLLAGLLYLGSLTHNAVAQPNGRIAFVHRNDAGERVIVTLRPDGTHVRRIAAGTGQPAYSAEAGKIAYRCGRARRRDICVVGADGSRPRHVTSDRKSDKMPSWSPDGRWLAFARGASSGKHPSNIFIIRPNGTGLKRITHCYRRCIRPSWSPDGKRIAYVDSSNDVDGCTCWVHLKRHFTRDVSDRWAFSPPQWSPNGRRIVFDWGDRRLYLVDTDGSDNPEQITDFASVTPDWSPDGRWIVFSRKRTHSLWRMHPDGTHLHPVTKITGRWPSWDS